MKGELRQGSGRGTWLEEGALEEGPQSQPSVEEGSANSRAPSPDDSGSVAMTDLEALYLGLRRAAMVWRRSNRVHEMAVRRLLLLHGTRPPSPPPSATSLLLGEAARYVWRVVASSPAVRACWGGVTARCAPACRAAAAHLPPELQARVKGALGGDAPEEAHVSLKGPPDTCASSPRASSFEEWLQRPPVAAALEYLGFLQRSAWRLLARAWSRAAWGVLLGCFSLLVLSELSLVLQFGKRVPIKQPPPPTELIGWPLSHHHPPPPPPPVRHSGTPTLLGSLLSLGQGVEAVHEGALFVVGILLLLSCMWSLERLPMGLFWYRMAKPNATDNASLAFNAAFTSRIAIMLCYNLDLLVFPVEAEGYATSQTRFYCTFGRKARMVVLGRDYYLLAFPLLLLLITTVLYRGWFNKLRGQISRLLHAPQIARFQFGRTAITWHEDRGRELLEALQAMHASWADKTLSRAARRNWRGVRRVPRREPEEEEDEDEASREDPEASASQGSAARAPAPARQPAVEMF